MRRLLFIGDVVGRPGLQLVTKAAGPLRRREQLDWIVANAENVEEGSGLTRAQFRSLMACGLDGITLGDHIYRKREIIEILEQDGRIVRPANYPPDAPGREWTVLENARGDRLGLVSLMGRVFMEPVDCPFRAVDRVLLAMQDACPAILVDFHAEATSDKQLMGAYLDGRVTAVLGTHTHVTTADERILSAGTAFQCDVGMTGPHDGIIGRRYERVLETTLTQRPTSFLVATGDVRLSGTLVDFDETAGRAVGIRRLSVTEAEVDAMVESHADDRPD